MKRAPNGSACFWISLVIVLLALAGCSDTATSLKVVITFSSIQLNQVALKGEIDGKVRFGDKGEGERFPSKPAEKGLSSGDDIIIIFADEDAGKTITVTATGLWQAQKVGTATGSATLAQGEVVELGINLGPQKPSDGGVDMRDAGRDILLPDGKPDGVKVPDLPGTPDLPKLPDAGCKVGTSFCSGNAIVTCVGTESGTNQISLACPLGCVVSAPVKCRDLVPSNGIPSKFLESGLSDFKPKPNITVMINSDTGKIVNDGALPATMTAPQSHPGKAIMVMAFNEIHIPKGTTVTVYGSNALALVASGSIKIEGVINAAGGLMEPGPGGWRGATQNQVADGVGAGANGGHKKLELVPNLVFLDVTGGGGGGAHGAVGGKGGEGQHSKGNIGGGSGGKTYSTLMLQPLTGGSGGGRGGAEGNGHGNYGGGGGGAIQIVSRTLISVGSTTSGGGINVGGGGGGAASETYRGGGGGGSGGGLLLEAPTVTVLPGAVLAANGGGGGGGTGSKLGASNGANGGLSDKLTNYGTESSNGGNGGHGGAGKTPAGLDGSPKIAAGGGGGGAGIIRINTYTGAATVGGSISGLESQGKVKTYP